MYKLVEYLTYVILLTRFFTFCDSYSSMEDTPELPEMTRHYKTRCTRRYSPGVCASRVEPVWTYVFQSQNCTERLGCANNFHANRFRTYDSCMKHCQALAEVYLQMLDFNDTILINSNVRLRERDRTKHPHHVRQGVPLNLDDEEDYDQDKKEVHSIVYKELRNDYGIYPPDVDRDDGEIREQYDMLYT